MTTIGNSQVSQAQIDAARNSANVEAPAPVERQREHRVLPPGGLSAAAGAGALPYASASLDGIDWDAIAADLSTTDTASIQLSQILELLINTMSDLRKGQRDAWLADAQNALALGLSAADKMRDSAVAKLACDVLSNGAAIVTAGLSMASSGATLVKSTAVRGVVEGQARAIERANAKAVESAQAKVAEEVTKKATDVGGAAKALQNAPQWETNPAYVKPTAEELKGLEAGGKSPTGLSDGLDELEPVSEADLGSEGPANRAGTLPTEPKYDAGAAQLEAKQAELKLWVTQEQSRLMQPWNAKADIFSKGLDIAGALGKTGASIGEFYASLKQAEAQEARARGEYASNVGQVELDFANELRDNIKAALDSWKSVEASRHQAVQGIYNI